VKGFLYHSKLDDTPDLTLALYRMLALDAAHAQVLRPEPRGNSEIHLLGASGTATIRDMTAERLSISLRKTGKRLHAIFKPGLWPSEVQNLPAPSCII